MLKKIPISFLLLLCMQMLQAQHKVVLEKLRCLSFNSPVKYYLSDPSVKKIIAADLNSVLEKRQMISLTDTTQLPVEFIPYGVQILPPVPSFQKGKDSSLLHLYLDVFETSPGAFFTQSENMEADSEMIKRAATVLLIRATIFNGNSSVFLREILSVVISPAETPGMGYSYGNGIRYADLTVVPGAFTKLLKASNDVLFNPKNEAGSIEIKVQPAYLLDNYILPQTINKPHILVNTKKGISTYRLNNATEMIRMDERLYEEIRIRGNKTEVYPGDVISAIRATPDFSKSEYVFLRQEGRDVIRNQNYLLKLIVQLNPAQIPDNQDLLFTNFLPGEVHFLFLEKDTLARFSIQKGIPSKKEVYPDIISNGYDTAAVYKLPVLNKTESWQVVYDYVVSGKIGKQSFTIKCSGSRNTVKEFFLDDKPVCIAQGRFNPEKFVLFDASLSPELLNRLFLIGFNRFFE